MSGDQVLKLVRYWAEAESRSDADTLEGLMTDDCTLIGPRGFVLDRQQTIDRYRSGALHTEAFDWSDIAVYQGQDASGRFRATQIVVQQEGGWKCAELQFSGPIPEMSQRNQS